MTSASMEAESIDSSRDNAELSDLMQISPTLKMLQSSLRDFQIELHQATRDNSFCDRSMANLSFCLYLLTFSKDV